MAEEADKSVHAGAGEMPWCGVNLNTDVAVIASDSEAIQTRALLPRLSLDCFALLAMTGDNLPQSARELFP
jgi:hypothetical protein